MLHCSTREVYVGCEKNVCGLVSTGGGKDERLFSRKSTVHFMLPYMFRHHTIHSSHLVHELSHHCFHFQLRFVSFECCFVLSVSLN